MHAPLYITRYNKTPSRLVRTDDYKLVYFHGDSVQEANYKNTIPGERYELYNIRDDIPEQHDFAQSLPKKTAELKTKLHEWLKGTGAKMPVMNPFFDPESWSKKTSSEVDYHGDIKSKSSKKPDENEKKTLN